MKAHKWEIEEVDGGPVGTEDFWICRQCGASGGPVCYTDGTKHEPPPSFEPFLADGSGLKLTHDCEESLKMIQDYIDSDTH